MLHNMLVPFLNQEESQPLLKYGCFPSCFTGEGEDQGGEGTTLHFNNSLAMRSYFLLLVHVKGGSNEDFLLVGTKGLKTQMSRKDISLPGSQKPSTVMSRRAPVVPVSRAPSEIFTTQLLVLGLYGDT